MTKVSGESIPGIQFDLPASQSQGRNQPVRVQHRHEDFQVNSRLIFFYFSTTYGASVAGLCTTMHNNAQLIPAKLQNNYG